MKNQKGPSRENDQIFLCNPYIHPSMIHTKFHRNQSAGSEKPLWGWGAGGMVKNFGRNPFINTQGWHIPNFIEIGPLVPKTPFGGERGDGRELVFSYIRFGRYHSSIIFKFWNKIMISFQVISNLKFSKSLKITPPPVGGWWVCSKAVCGRYPLIPF